MTEAERTLRAYLDAFLAENPFVGHLGIDLLDCAPGRCAARLPIRQELMQHTGTVHAGVISALADQCAGVAALTLVPADRTVVTVEFKINLLRPASGNWLLCRAQVLRPGRTLSVAEAEVLTETAGGATVLAAKLTATLAVIERR